MSRFNAKTYRGSTVSTAFRAAMLSLLAGPGSGQRSSGVTSGVPSGTRLLGLTIDRGTATVDLSSEFEAAADAIIDRLKKELADSKGCTAAQLALAWLLAQGENIVPIPGTKKRSRLTENLGAVDVELTPEDLQRLDELAPAGLTAGDRYPDMRTIDV